MYRRVPATLVSFFGFVSVRLLDVQIREPDKFRGLEVGDGVVEADPWVRPTEQLSAGAAQLESHTLHVRQHVQHNLYPTAGATSYNRSYNNRCKKTDVLCCCSQITASMC